MRIGNKIVIVMKIVSIKKASQIFNLKRFYTVRSEVTEMFFCSSLSSGDAPYCTPEQYKECADPALGERKLPSFLSI